MTNLTGSYRRHRFQSLSAIEAQARGEQDPFQLGYEEGLRQGQERGFQQGLEDGRVQGEAQGYETGYQKGLLEGQALGQQAFNQAMAPLQAIGRALEELRQQNLADHTEHLCGLVEQVARRVIHAELSLNPDQLRKLVEDALSRMDTRKGEVTVFLSPDDCARLAEIGTDRIGGCPLQAVGDVAGARFEVGGMRCRHPLCVGRVRRRGVRGVVPGGVSHGPRTPRRSRCRRGS